MNFTAAIVLGGAGGMGKEICLQLVGRDLKNLAIIDIVDEETVANKFNAEFGNIKFIYKKCSVTDEPKLRECMNDVKNQFDRIDVIVNAFAVLDELNPKKTIDVNYGGVVNSTLIGIDLMRKDQGMQGGCIVNISSVAALRTHFISPVYAGTKHAILGFTRSLKNDAFFDSTGVKFILICPGLTYTPLIDGFELKLLFPTMLQEVKTLGRSYAAQKPVVVAKCVLTALDDGENGSTWQCENGRYEKLNIVEYLRF